MKVLENVDEFYIWSNKYTIEFTYEELMFLSQTLLYSSVSTRKKRKKELYEDILKRIDKILDNVLV